MFTGLKQKLALLALGRAAMAFWGAMTGKDSKTMNDQTKYNYAIGLWKAAKAAGGLYAAGAFTASGLGGVMLPTSVEEFRTQWPQLVVAIIGGAIKFGMNYWKNRA